MKLKKLLAAVTAAALAITTMAVTSFTASALDTSNEIVIGEFFSGSKELTTKGGSIASDGEWSSQWVQLSENNMSNGYDWDKVAADSNAYLKATFSFNSLAADLHNSGSGQAWYAGDIKAGSVVFSTETATVTADTDYVAYVLINVLSLGEKDQWGQKGLNMQAASGDSGQIIILKKAELVTLGAIAPEMTLVPETSTVEVGKTKTLTAAVTGATGGTFTVASSDDAKASATVDADGKVTVTGVAEGTADITVTYTYNGTETLTKTCAVTVVGAGATAQTVELPFPTTVIQLPIIEDQYDNNALKATTNVEIMPAAVTGKTYGDLSTTTLKLTGVQVNNCTLDGVTADDISATLYTSWGNYNWKAASGVALSSGEIVFDLSTITGVADTDDLKQCGVQLAIPAAKLGDLSVGDIVLINDDGSTKMPVKGSVTVAPNNWWGQVDVPIATLFGNLDRSTGVIKFIGSSEFKIAYTPVGGEWTAYGPSTSFTVNISDLNSDAIGIINTTEKDTLIVNWAASIGGTVAPDPIPGGDTPGGDTPGGDTPVTPPVVSGNSVTMGSTEYTGWYEAVLTKDQLFGSNTGATTITFTGADLAKVGYNSISAGGYKGIDCTGTVTIQVSDIDLSDNFFLHVGGNAATVVTWSFNGGSSDGNEPSNPTDPSNPSAPSSSGSTYEPPIPSGSTSISIVDSILGSSAAGLSFNLGSSAKLDKEVFEALASKGDITVRFNVAGGAYWEISGANVTAAKAVDLGVRMNSNLIPASAVSELAGDKTTIQLSLKNNGDFGFTGVLNVPVGKANDGKFANLYYYHSGKFDFVGSSAISNGRAKFAFSHASNYLIVIDDYAYGEDVSSAAGMTETTETSAVPYVAALVVVSAFAASAVVLKKRLSK